MTGSRSGPWGYTSEDASSYGDAGRREGGSSASRLAVEFKLHAPCNTTIEGKYVNGNVKNLIVTQPERWNDIKVRMIEQK